MLEIKLKGPELVICDQVNIMVINNHALNIVVNILIIIPDLFLVDSNWILYHTFIKEDLKSLDKDDFDSLHLRYVLR